MGTTYGGDVKSTLENQAIFQPAEPEDPVTRYKSDYDKDGETVISYTKKITHKQAKEFNYAI